MQYHIHKGHGGPVLVQYRLANQQQLELWVGPEGIAEGGFIVNEIFNNDEYFKHGITIKPGDTVVDVGANIGIFGARALSCVLGGDILYCGIEPSPQSFKLLQQNLMGQDAAGEQNSVFHINQHLSAPLKAQPTGRVSAAYPGNVRLVQAAVSSESSSRPLTFFPRMPGNSTLRPEEKLRMQGNITPPQFLAGSEEVHVRVTTLPQLLKEMDIKGLINLLKIDVEGEELEVLRGLTAPYWQLVQQVAVEVHDCLEGDPQSQEGAPPAPQGQRAAADSLLAAQQQQHTDSKHNHRPVGGPFPVYERLMAALPGPRTGHNIDGELIKYIPLPIQPPEAVKSTLDPAKVAALSRVILPPPQDQGRVMAVARLLRDKGFRVAMECSLGLPLNYTVYGVKCEV